MVNGLKKIIERGDLKNRSEGEMQTYEEERAKDMRGDWSEGWPSKRKEAVKAAAAAAHSGVDAFLCLDSKN